MDPTTTTIITGAISGAAGGFIQEVTSNGMQWLYYLLKGQSPQMQAKAKENMENFVIRLAQRVERLECELPANKAQIFQEALNHPSSALLIKTAIIDSATTDNDDRHELLAELIAQRLTANADDMIALAGAAACSVVNCLTSRQIKLLAMLVTIKDTRPLQTLNIEDLAIAKEYIFSFWRGHLSPLIEDGFFEDTNQLDYEHLAALGCIRISIGSVNLIEYISYGFVNPFPQFSEDDFNNEQWFQSIKKQWEPIGSLTTTSVGRLIGVLFKDARLKTKTVINW